MHSLCTSLCTARSRALAQRAHASSERSAARAAAPLLNLAAWVGRPLVILLGPGQGGDSPMLPALLASLRVPRIGAGRPRTTPDALLGDKAYSARAHRAPPHPRRHHRDPRTGRPASACSTRSIAYPVRRLRVAGPALAATDSVSLGGRLTVCRPGSTSPGSYATGDLT